MVCYKLWLLLLLLWFWKPRLKDGWSCSVKMHRMCILCAQNVCLCVGVGVGVCVCVCAGILFELAVSVLSHHSGWYYDRG